MQPMSMQKKCNSYNYWKVVETFCYRYHIKKLSDKELKDIKKIRIFCKNDKWLVLWLIIFSVSLYVLVENQKLLLVSLF
jgi:hypothetical protein